MACSDVCWTVPKTSIAPTVAPALVFVKGQLWNFGARCIEIRHVGKLLVTHRGVALDKKQTRAPIRMISIKELRDFLVEQHAVLVAT
jgi:hypothetical protein